MQATPMGWRVTAQNHVEQYMPNGNFERVAKVSVVTANGTHATFDFPEAQYNADNVVNRINAWAEHEDAIAKLGNG